MSPLLRVVRSAKLHHSDTYLRKQEITVPRSISLFSGILRVSLCNLIPVDYNNPFRLNFLIRSWEMKFG